MRTGLLLMAMCGAAALMGQEQNNLPLPESGNVTLPLDEYNKLVELASKPAKKAEAPPFLHAIRRAEWKVEVAGDVAKGTAHLEGEVMGKGAIEVPLISGTTVLDARQKGKELPLEQKNGTHMVVVNGPAEFDVMLDAALPVRIEASRATMSLPAPAAGAVELTMKIPGEGAEVHLNSGLIVSRASSGGKTTIEATLVPGHDATIWWTARETAPAPAQREVRFLSDVKTLVTVDEAELTVAALADLTVLQGQPSQFLLSVPAGFEVTSATGTSLDSSEIQSGALALKLNNAAQRSHQFLITMEKPLAANKADAPFSSFQGAQRETGEVLVEGTGTMELTAKESGGLKRVDLRETNAYLRSLAHETPHAAFRFHRQPGETPALALEWVRFPGTTLLAAVAERVQATTLVTSEGHSLTEVRLDVRNQAQPFLKVALPAGANLLSADVAGERVKPVQGADGSRVPLLRPGFRPSGSYRVSYVFQHAGAPFSKKGEAELDLPRMDVPVALLEWEVFLPEQYKVKNFGGDAISVRTLPPANQETAMELNVPLTRGAGSGRVEEAALVKGSYNLEGMGPGEIGGVIVDPTGGVVTNAQVTATLADGTTRSASTDGAGRWKISGIPSGTLKLVAASPGFNSAVRDLDHDARRAGHYSFVLQVGSVSETVTVAASAPEVQRESERIEREARKTTQSQENQASANVLNLQRRVAGVLPIAIDVPRSGTSFQFLRPLVIDEQTRLTFSYGIGKK